MKKTIILLTSLILILSITACSGEVAESSSESSNIQARTVTLNSDYENALSVQMQLILGTVKLEDTEYAVEADKAAELLPLWKAARSLSQSDTAAVAETESIFKQISETMTVEQLEAIVAMQLSQGDFADAAGNLGIEMGNGGKFGDMSPEEIAAAQAARGGDFVPPEGVVPGSGQGRGTLEGTLPGESGGLLGTAPGINPRFFDAIIELLEAKL